MRKSCIAFLMGMALFASPALAFNNKRICTIRTCDLDQDVTAQHVTVHQDMVTGQISSG